jgi:aldose 1-epimerase
VTAHGEIFGRTADGQPVHKLAVAGGGLHADIITWGAVIQDLRMDAHPPPLVLGLTTFEHYLAHSPYFGAMAGRCANRIRGGTFIIDGQRHQADTNFVGKHTLHGGAMGIGKRIWTVAERGADFVTLTLRDPDGWMGFPGDLDITCTYSLQAHGILSVELSAVTNRTTLCNLAHHSYFNLDDGGASDALDHLLEIKAEAFLPVDEDLIPTGRIVPVSGTDFDFRTLRPIRRQSDGKQIAYDHNWCLAGSAQPCRRVARLCGKHSGVSMEVWTTEPGLQFYAGHKAAREVAGLGGRQYGAYAGICLEPQIWPDASSHCHFPQALIRPGETYRQITQYRFDKTR